MRNLLTRTFKRRLKQEYMLRLVAVSGWVLTAAMAIGTVAVFPAYLFSRLTHDELTKEYRALEASAASLASGASAASLSVLKKKLAVLSAKKEDERLTDALLSVLERRGGAVALTSFDYSRSETEMVVRLHGVAASRDGLLSFEKALESDGRFGSVELPLSHLASERDVEFEITLRGAH